MKKNTILSVACLCALVGCKKEAAPTPPPPSVTIANPTQQDVTRYLYYTGNIEANTTVALMARVKGYLTEMNFNVGQEVKKGSPLYLIQKDQYEANFNQAQANLASAKATLKLAEATLSRKEGAFKDNAVSEIDVIEATAQRDEAIAGVHAAEASLKNAQLDLSYTTVSSPIDGRISRSLVDVGNLVGATGATTLTTVVNSDPMYVYFSISENDLLAFLTHRKEEAQKKKEAITELGLGNNKKYPFTGKIDFLDNRVDQSTGTIQLRGVFDNKEGDLIDGMFARVRIPVATRKNALLVPRSAIRDSQRGTSIFIVDSSNKATERFVQLGVETEAGVEILDNGIKADEWVITEGILKARNGAPVTPEKANETTAKSAK